MKALNEKKLKNPIRSVYHFSDENVARSGETTTTTTTQTGTSDTTNTTFTMTTSTHRNTGFAD